MLVGAFKHLSDADLETVQGGAPSVQWRSNGWRGGSATFSDGSYISVHPLSTQVGLSANAANSLCRMLDVIAVAAWNNPGICVGSAAASSVMDYFNRGGNGITINQPHAPMGPVVGRKK